MTFTSTPTYTDTPTVTPTPVPFPYSVTIDVYNEAGELIKLVTQTLISGQVGDVILMTNGQPANTFDPKEYPLVIKLPGIQSPGQTGGALTSTFTWDGTNNNGQTLLPGTYYIKTSYTDNFNHVETKVQEVQVLYVDKHLRISIYNSAGELVQRLQAKTVPDKLSDLTLDEVLALGVGAPPDPIEYAPGQILYWDGTNLQGRLVDSGIYEVVVELDNGDGYKISSSKAITVINDGSKNLISSFKAYPNPAYISSSAVKPITFTWVPKGTGTVRIDIFDQSAGLVNRIEVSMISGTASWYLTNSNNEQVASGLYVMVIYAKKDTGEIQTLVSKTMIVRKY
jgi:hypothetical protein